MVALFTAIIGALRSAFRPRASLVAENLVLRQQLAVLRRKTKRPQLAPIDRAFGVVLSRVWSRWAETLWSVASHPLVGSRSQSPKSVLQRKPQVCKHVGVALLRAGQVVPQPPQFEGSTAVLAQ